MKKHEAIQYVVSNFMASNEWGDVHLMAFLRMIQNDDTTVYTRVYIHHLLEANVNIYTVKSAEHYSDTVLDMRDWADAHGIPTINIPEVIREE